MLILLLKQILLELKRLINGGSGADYQGSGGPTGRGDGWSGW